ncbi:MAG: ankyrin repeat domain-containing protein [Myxococcota bacterium]
MSEAGPFAFGVTLRVRADLDAMRDRFSRGELLVCWQIAWSRYDGVTGYFFRQAEAPDVVRSYDVSDGEAPRWDTRFEVAAPVHPLVVAAQAGAVPEGVAADGLVAALAMEAAIDAGHAGALERLLASASGLSEQTRVRLFHHAARVGKAGCVEVFLGRGQPVDAQDSGGQTALIAAIGAGDPATVRALLNAGADPDHATSSGVSARSLAEAYRRPEILRRAEE